MWLEILAGIVALFLLLYYYTTKNFGKFKQLNLPHAEGSFPFGSFNFMSGVHIDNLSLNLHQQYKNEKYFGYFLLGKPFIGVNDPDVLRLVQVKDFDHFVDRLDPTSMQKFFKGGRTDQLWGKQLTSLSGDEWKDVRGVFTPIFTSGKMRNMLKFIQHISHDLENEFGNHAKAGDEFELKTVFGKFSLDALASSAFGVNAESFTNKNSKFVENAARIFQQKPLDMLIGTIRCIPGVPELFQFFQISTNNPKPTKFFVDIITKSIQMRRQTKERKNDLIDLMLDAIKEENIIEDDDGDDQYERDMKLNHKRKKQIDEDMIIATSMVLLVAGYDTTGMTLSYMAYEMANNPDVQSKLQEEIDEAFEESNDKFPDYNVIQSLPYLDMVIHEVLRVHPPVGLNTRAAEKEYKLPDSNIVLKKGDALGYNARFLHNLPEHWSHPDQFYPEHFSKEEKANRNPYVFQAFGQGPRACIGMRFALLEAKVAAMAVLRKYSFKPGTKTITPLQIDSNSQLAYPKGGLWVRVEKRDE